MSDYGNYVERITVDKYRKYVLSAYSAIGFAIAAVAFFCTWTAWMPSRHRYRTSVHRNHRIFNWVGWVTANAIYFGRGQLVAVLTAMRLPTPGALGL